jgi:hypothetical protein
MTKRRAWTVAAGLLACGWVIGCDRPPDPPVTVTGDVPRTLAVIEGNQDESRAVMAAETARVNYRYRLVVLQDYYRMTGGMDKLRWTQRELDNLDQAHTFTWEGLPEIAPPKGESLEGADEYLLVEYAVAARKAYRKAMAELLAYYQTVAPNSYKAKRVANVLARFDPVHTYMYLLEAEIPGKDIRPGAVIPAADALYEKALRLHVEGKGLLRTFVTTSYGKQRQALMLLRELTRKYPTSTKMPLAAFYIGEIYKEYFRENIRAVHWYERAWQWDPNITKPARYQAAVVHDLRLFNKAKAVELYRQVIQHEQFKPDNVRYAHQRIRELTGT